MAAHYLEKPVLDSQRQSSSLPNNVFTVSYHNKIYMIPADLYQIHNHSVNVFTITTRPNPSAHPVLFLACTENAPFASYWH